MGEPAVAGQELNEAQKAFLTAEAARIASESSAIVSPAADQAATAAAMTERGPLLPAEERIDELMAALRAQSDQIAAMQAQMGTVQRQMEEAQAATGGPLTVRYAQGAADKLDSLQLQYANFPAGTKHFDAPREAAGRLVEAAKAIAKNGGKTTDVDKAIADIEKFLKRTHFKLGGSHVDWSAIGDDLELAGEEAAKLVAAV